MASISDKSSFTINSTQVKFYITSATSPCPAMLSHIPPLLFQSPVDTSRSLWKGIMSAIGHTHEEHNEQGSERDPHEAMDVDSDGNSNEDHSDEESDGDISEASYDDMSAGDSDNNVNDFADLQLIESFTLPCGTQDDSPLFATLPAEIQELVYEYAFAEYEDMSREYEFDSCYRRPGYMAPRTTDTALLRTCQTIYREAWYFPWTLAQHTFYTAWGGRKPKKTTDVTQMTYTCALIERFCQGAPEHRKIIPHVQIFGQLCYIENGRISPILAIPHFKPRSVTITIRHTDFWNWEGDSPLHISSRWVRDCRMPSSVNTVRMQIESLQRKKVQIDYMADRIKKTWYWQRTDGVHLVANSPIHSETWPGSSTWEGRRWERDEDIHEPGRICYNIATISFNAVDPKEDSEGYELRKEFAFDNLEVPFEIYRHALDDAE